jgi:hypothetical protein
MSTAVPSSDLAEFHSYTSVASSWWAARSSGLAEIKEQCPITWNDVKNRDVLFGEIWLNATIALADCDGEEIPAAAKSQHAAVSASPSAVMSGSALASTSASPLATVSASPATKLHGDVISAVLAVAILIL